MPRQPIDVQYPLAGQDRRLSYQSQAPYSSPKLNNSWPRDPLEGRLRGGSRPGLAKALPTQMSAPVHLLANVRVVEKTGITSFTDQFPPATIRAWWETAAWLPDKPLIPLTSPDDYVYAFDFEERTPNNVGLVFQTLDIDTTVQYEIVLQILPDVRDDNDEFSAAHGTHGSFSIFARMDDDVPNVQSAGVELRWVASTGMMEMYNDGALIASAFVPIVLGAGQLKLRITSDDKASGFFDIGSSDTERITPQSVGTPAGERIGFGINGPLFTYATRHPSLLARRRVDYFRIDHTVVSPSYNRNIVVAAGGKNASATYSGDVDLRYEDTPNALVAPAKSGAGADTTMTNDKVRQLQAVELLGKLYIVGEDQQDDASDAPIWVLDPIATGDLRAISDSASGYSGTAPVNCTAIAAWRGRLVVVSRDDPHNVSMSRVAAPLDWAYASLPIGSAIQLNTTGVDSGKLAEPVNCLIAHSDDYLLLGCLNSLYVIRGEVAYGAGPDQLSSSIGIVAPQAWARGPNGETVFLSNDGLYGLPAGVLAYPKSVSRERLPDELRDIDVNNYRVLMAWDLRNRGVFIGLTPMLAGGGTYFWFDWEMQSFCPMEFNASFEPTALVYRNADAPLDQRLLLGCRDGHIRTFERAAGNDDGVDFNTETLIGPIALGGGGYYDGMILEIIGQLGQGSDDVTCSVQVGKSVEDAFRATPRFSRTLRAGKNITYRPRLRGNTCFIRLSTTTGRWALENLTLVRERLGKQRL